MRSPNYLNKLLILFIGLFVPFISFAQHIKGKVTDATTKEAMVGTTVLLKEAGKNAAVQLDGYFAFKNLKPGEYNLEFHFVSYKTKHVHATVNANKTTFVNVVMEPNMQELNSVNIVDNDN
jgi:5-hydroxyisourate hydrolase-like protein (transthyretin family)